MDVDFEIFFSISWCVERTVDIFLLSFTITSELQYAYFPTNQFKIKQMTYILLLVVYGSLWRGGIFSFVKLFLFSNILTSKLQWFMVMEFANILSTVCLLVLTKKSGREEPWKWSEIFYKFFWVKPLCYSFYNF